MNEERKTPGITFWSAIAAIGIALYPLSFGPACWLNRYTGIGGRWIAVAYEPFAERLWAGEPKLIELYIESAADRQLRHLGRRRGELLLWYAELGAGDRLLSWDHDR